MRRLIQPSFLLCLGLLALVEIFLRCTLSPLAVAAFQYGYHPDSGFQETADGLVHLVPGPTRDFHAQTFSRTRPPGGFRIFTLGSSVEYWDAKASHVLSNTYPARLESELRRRGLNAESINLAVTGYGTLHNEVLLRQALTYQPDLIIFKLDVTNEGTDAIRAERAREFTSFWPQDWLWKSYLVQIGLQWKEAELMSRTLPLHNLTGNSAPAGKLEAIQSAGAAPFTATSRQALVECLQLARRQGVPVLLVTQAYVTRDAAGSVLVTDHGLDAFAAAFCGSGVRMLSFTQLFGRLPVADNFVDQVHLTRPAHQFVAQALAEAVSAMPRRPAPDQ